LLVELYRMIGYTTPLSLSKPLVKSDSGMAKISRLTYR